MLIPRLVKPRPDQPGGNSTPDASVLDPFCPSVIRKTFLGCFYSYSAFYPKSNTMVYIHLVH